MRTLLRVIIVVVFALVGLVAAMAEPSDESRRDPESLRQRLSEFQPQLGEDLAQPGAPASQDLTEETAKAYQQTLRAYYDYRRSGYDHRLGVFGWQFITSKIIFLIAGDLNNIFEKSSSFIYIIFL